MDKPCIIRPNIAVSLPEDELYLVEIPDGGQSDIKDIVSIRCSQSPYYENSKASITAFSIKDGKLEDGSLVKARQFDAELSSGLWGPQPEDFRDDALSNDPLFLASEGGYYGIGVTWPWMCFSGTVDSVPWEAYMRRLDRLDNWGLDNWGASDDPNTKLVLTRKLPSDRNRLDVLRFVEHVPSTNPAHDNGGVLHDSVESGRDSSKV